MRKSRYTDQQIALALQQAEAGAPVAEVCRKYGIAEQTLRADGDRQLHAGVSGDEGGAGLARPRR
jgi:transposase-like protein